MGDLEAEVEAARANVEVLLARRADLVASLVDALGVSALAPVQEASLRTRAARARLDAALRAGDWPAVDAADRAYAAVLPDLEAQVSGARGALVLRLWGELEETEARLAGARRQYNDAARRYNAYIDEFPQRLTARLLGARHRPLLTAADPETKTPGTEPGAKSPSSSGRD
jgi:LemA protein